MNLNTKKRISRIALGIIFLFNPNINVVDLLPDFIGCMLIISGLCQIRDISDSLEDARVNFLRMFWLSLSHIPAFFLMVSISANYLNEKTSILVFSFVYSVLEFVLLNNAMTSLIDGFEYIGERHDGDCCFYLAHKSGRKTGISRIRAFVTFTLFLVKAMTVAPNLVYLFDTSLGYGVVTNPYVINPIQFIGSLTVFAFIPALLFAIPWTIKTYCYIKGISRDADFIKRLDSVLSERSVENAPIYKYRRMSTLVILMCVGVAFSMDFMVDEFNIIPDLFAAVMFVVCAVFMIKKFSGVSRLLLPLTLIYAAAECAMLLIATNFSLHFSFSDVGRVVEADGIFGAYIIVLGACSVLFPLVLTSLTISFVRIFKDGASLQVRPNAVNTLKDTFFASYKRKAVFSILLGAASAVCYFVEVMSCGNMTRILIEKNSYTNATGMYVPSLEGFWMVTFVVNIVFIVFSCSLYHSAKEEMKDRLYII